MIEENSSAFIEGNKIKENKLANVAFGGIKSINTVIINNDIEDGEKEGIFVIESGKCLISGNKI